MSENNERISRNYQTHTILTRQTGTSIAVTPFSLRCQHKLKRNVYTIRNGIAKENQMSQMNNIGVQMHNVAGDRLRLVLLLQRSRYSIEHQFSN